MTRLLRDGAVASSVVGHEDLLKARFDRPEVSDLEKAFFSFLTFTSLKRLSYWPCSI